MREGDSCSNYLLLVTRRHRALMAVLHTVLHVDPAPPSVRHSLSQAAQLRQPSVNSHWLSQWKPFIFDLPHRIDVP